MSLSFYVITTIIALIGFKLGKTNNIEGFNYGVGSQAIAPCYKFDPARKRLEELADGIKKMGSNILKISLDPNGQLDAPDNHGYYYSKRISDPNTMVYKYLQDPKYNYYFFWVQDGGVYKSGQYKHLNYNVTYYKHLETKKMADYLLTTYNGQNKYFFIGNWEADWDLTDRKPNGNHEWNIYRKQSEDPIPQTLFDDTIVWLKMRQSAVQDARNAHPQVKNVGVYHYMEVNHVLVEKSNPSEFWRSTGKILPQVNPDFVSYSSYEAIGLPKDEAGIYNNLNEAICPS